MEHKKLSESQGKRLLRQLFIQGKRIFSTADAIAAAVLEKIPLRQLNKILSYLAKHRLLVRLRRGLYVSAGLLGEHSQPHPFAIATYLVQPSAISHWSALQHHGLTEQVPKVVMASTPNKVITPSMRKNLNSSLKRKHGLEVQGIHYRYITLQKKHFFGIEKIWVDENFQIPITDKERTLLDLFIYSKMFGGMGEALGILENALPHIDVSKLIHYAIQYGKPSLIKRLGWTLEYLGTTRQLLSPLLKNPIHYYCRLDPSAPAVGHCDPRWMIQNNLTQETPCNHYA